MKKLLGILVLGLILYNALLMKMLPLTSIKFECELSSTNINSYNIPRKLDLKINGYGSGKFTNDQYFGNNSFNLRTSSSRGKILSKIIGGSTYYFDIGVKNSEWGETHLFSIPKRNLSDKISSRLLWLRDFGNNQNEYPEAFWDCEQKK